MKKFLVSAIALVALLLWAPVGVQAQSTTTQTYITAAVNATQTTIPVNSVSGISASTQQQQQYVFTDGELMQVLSISGTTLTVTRGVYTRNTAHAANELLWAGPAGGNAPFTSQAPSLGATCTASQWSYLPLINYVSNQVINCLNSRWAYWDNTADSLRRPRQAVATTAYTAKLSDDYIGITVLSSATTVTIASPTGLTGKGYLIVNETSTASTPFSITPSSGLINGASSYSTTGAYKQVYVISNGSAWFAQ